MKRIYIILFLLLTSSMLFSACTSQPQDGLKKLSRETWKAELERSISGALRMSLTNPEAETITVFHYGPWHSRAYIFQKKTDQGWVNITADEGPVITLLVDDKWVHVPPGQTVVVKADLSLWSHELHVGDSVRLLLGVFPGKVTYKDVSEKPIDPIGYLCYEFQY